MNKAVEALYQAVQRNEAHASTIGRLLDVLEIGHRNARGNEELRRKLEGEIEYYTRQLGALQAERGTLSRAIMALRGGGE